LHRTVRVGWYHEEDADSLFDGEENAGPPTPTLRSLKRLRTWWAAIDNKLTAASHGASAPVRQEVGDALAAAELPCGMSCSSPEGVEKPRFSIRLPYYANGASPAANSQCARYSVRSPFAAPVGYGKIGSAANQTTGKNFRCKQVRGQRKTGDRRRDR